MSSYFFYWFVLSCFARSSADVKQIVLFPAEMPERIFDRARKGQRFLYKTQAAPIARGRSEFLLLLLRLEVVTDDVDDHIEATTTLNKTGHIQTAGAVEVAGEAVTNSGVGSAEVYDRSTGS